MIKVEGRDIFVDAPLHATSTELTVAGMRPTGSLQEIHDMAVDYWKKFWCSDDTTDLEKVRGVMDDFLPIPAFDAYISMHEFKNALGKTKPG